MISSEQINTLTRACLKAADGHYLVWGDYSAVEARANAWMAGDHAAVEGFLKNHDPYMALATRIYGSPVTDKKDPRRKVGKIGELACLGGNTLVLTDRGPCPITGVCLSDRLWDGQEWVSHRGLVPRGIRPVVDCCGVQATADHRVWLGADHWSPFGRLAQDESTLSRALANASGNFASQVSSAPPRVASGSSSCGVRARPLSTACTRITSEKESPRGATLALSGPRVTGSSVIGDMRRSFLTRPTGAGCSIGYRRACNGVETRRPSSGQTTVAGGSECTSRGGRTAPSSWPTWSRCKGGMTRIWNSIERTMIVATSLAICALSRSAGTKQTDEPSAGYNTESQNLRPVYDIAHAGPRNRFTILTDRGPLIVHNCGYGQGAGGPKNPRRGKGYGKPFGFYGFAEKNGVDWDEMAKSKPPITSKVVVDMWRELHAPIVQLWKALERGMLQAFAGRDNEVGVGCKVEWSRWNDAIVCTLPSGRALVYHGVHVGKGEYGPRLTYVGGKGREDTYGGKLCENVIQAICRDFLAEAEVKAEKEGLDPVLTVHDELVCEVPEALEIPARDRLHEIMVDLPPWGVGMPIGSSVFSGKRYRK